MKKDKKSIGLALLEGFAEIVLTLICFGIGAFVVSLFGVSLDSPNIDGDLIILLGVVVSALIFGAVYAFVQWIKKMFRERRGNGKEN